MTRDSITVLQCAPGLRLAKLIRLDSVSAYSFTRSYDGWTLPITSLADIENLVVDIIQKPRLSIVRGKLIEGETVLGIRRLIYRDPLTGDEPTLADVPRQWLALDIEGVPLPAQVAATDLHGCAKIALLQLPLAFCDAACLIQATAGHGIKPDLRLRLWFWLSRPVNGQELRRWLKGCPADPSIFGAAQIIYTAAPVFVGRKDHLSSRLLLRAGRDSVEVPSRDKLVPQSVRQSKPLPLSGSPSGSRYAWAALRSAVAAVASAKIDQRHATCLSASRSLARLVNAGLLSAAEVKDAMASALLYAGKTREEGDAIADWALAHSSSAVLPENIGG